MRDEIMEYGDCPETAFMEVEYDDCLIGMCYRIGDDYSPAYDLSKILAKHPDKETSIEDMIRQLVEKHPDTAFVKHISSVEELSEYNDEALLFDDLQEALIGIRFGIGEKPVALFDCQRCISCLMGDDMDEESANEWFQYNTIGSYVGVNTPAVFMTIDNVF